MFFILLVFFFIPSPPPPPSFSPFLQSTQDFLTPLFRSSSLPLRVVDDSQVRSLGARRIVWPDREGEASPRPDETL